MRSILSLCGLAVTIANCGVNHDILPPGSSTPEQHGHPVKEYLSSEFKQWFQNLGNTPVLHGVSKANVNIVPNTSWENALQLQKVWIVVNASNENISFGGGGLNGALVGYVNAIGQHTQWENLRLPPAPPAMWATGPIDIPFRQGKVPVGAYAISDVGLLSKSGTPTVEPSTKRGEIYHAVGPRASEVTSLSDAQDKVKTLYYNICKRAAHHTGYLVLPAISTDIFADADYTKLSFTKNQFIAAMYEGMYQGIRQYETEPRASSQGTCHIILNKWKPPLQ